MVEDHTINEDIYIDSYNVNLLDKKGNILAGGRVEAVQKFQPQPKFVFSGELSLKGNPGALITLDPVQCEFVDLKQTVPVILINTELGKKFLATFVVAKPPLTIDKNKKLKSIKFNLVNFNKELNRAEVKFDDWRLNLENIASKNEYDKLDDIGGFLITHKGEITKSENIEFSVGEAEEILGFLYQLFSFCKGFSTQAFFVEGFDSNNNMSWTEIGDKRLDPWTECDNWFSNSKINLNDFVEGFYHFCQNDSFKEHINEIIYWYTTINDSKNNYSSIILAHTALELISWINLTENINVLSKNGFSSLPAGDCLALSLGYRKIPPKIPSELKNLKKLGKSDNLNAPLLFSTIRNKIVHPPSKRRNQFTRGRTIFEAKLLGVWYLELLILSESNYEGEYTNRLNYSGWKGETELVPWAKNT